MDGGMDEAGLAWMVLQVCNIGVKEVITLFCHLLFSKYYIIKSLKCLYATFTGIFS